MSAPSLAVRERPILFSGEMVRAILDGRKSQTRRVVMRRGREEGESYTATPSDGFTEEIIRRDYPCPYGQPGDRLWVRETWSQVHPCQIDDGRDSRPGTAGIPGPPPVEYRVIYRADGEYPTLHFSHAFPYRVRCQHGCTVNHIHPEETYCGWTPSIHMPRWASRLTLEISDIRVERVQEITPDDAIAEGYPPELRAMDEYPVDWFGQLWNQINASRGYGWDANPWVWAISFRKVQP